MKFNLILGVLPDSWDTFVTTHGNDRHFEHEEYVPKNENIRELKDKDKVKHNNGSGQ